MTPTLRRIAGLAVSLLVVLGFAACGRSTNTATEAADAIPAGGPVVVKHAQGELTLDKTPERVVVMDLGALDTLNALGLGDKVVGLPKSNVPDFLKAFEDKKFADVGTLQEPKYEEINKLNPDLVIVGFRSAKQFPEMSKHFPTIDITYNTADPFLEGVGKASRIVGTAFGKQAQVDEKLKALDEQAKSLANRGPKAGKGMILMTSAGKVSLHGPGSRFGAIHTVAGVTPAVTDIQEDSHGQPISFEFIAEHDPDVMFVVDRDAAVGQNGANAKQILDNAVVNGTKAAKNGRVVMLDGARWYLTIHGLDNTRAMLDEIAQGLPA